MNDDEVMAHFSPLYADLGGPDEFPAARPLLAHYTSLATLEKILATDEVWLSNPLLMNDFEELRFGMISAAGLIRESAGIRDACGSPERANLFIESFEAYFKQFENEHAFDTYVLCLSEHDPDDFDGVLSMWRGYGGNGNGIAVVIDTKQFNAIENSPLIIAKVRYGSTQQRLDWLTSLLRQFSEILGAAQIPDEKLYVAAYLLFQRIKLFALFSKHCGFREEQEWRIAIDPERDTGKLLAPMLHYAISQRGAEPKLRMRIAPIDGLSHADHEMSLEKVVERIILGPTASSPMAKKAVSRMLEKLNKSSLIERVHASAIPFRST